MVVYLFPGQGAQFVGMGKDVFKKYNQYIKQADDILGYSIEQLCIEDKYNQLNSTQYTQPALYVVNALNYLDKQHKMPGYFAGHSLGEYSALFAAGCFDFSVGLAMVKKRGELMSKVIGGAMAAVIGLDIEDVKLVLEKSGLDNINIANHNSPNQIVISGKKEDIEKARRPFELAGVELFHPLNVSGAFHSDYMSDVQAIFSNFIADIDIYSPVVPVISNVTGQPHKTSEIKEQLVKQLSSPVKWVDSIKYMISAGVENFEECGPGLVLTNLLQTIIQDKLATVAS